MGRGPVYPTDPLASARSFARVQLVTRQPELESGLHPDPQTGRGRGGASSSGTSSQVVTVFRGHHIGLVRAWPARKRQQRSRHRAGSPHQGLSENVAGSYSVGTTRFASLERKPLSVKVCRARSALSSSPIRRL